MHTPHDRDGERQPLSPVALSLAIWLALLMGIMGLERVASQPAWRGDAAPISASASYGMALAFGI